MSGNSHGSNSDRLAAAEWLATGDGGAALDSARRMAADGVSAPNALARLQSVAADTLDKRVAAVGAAQVWNIAAGRDRAVVKFGLEDAEKLLFDSDGLQMTSGRTAAGYHARLAAESGAVHVVDMTAGIGADTVAFARAGLRVSAFERDPERAVFLAANIARLGLSGMVEVLRADSLEALTKEAILEPTCLFLDPPRRTDENRWGNADAADRMIDHAIGQQPRAVLVKLAPAADHAYAQRYSGAMEFVSIGGECREAILRIGSLNMGARSSISAVLLPSGDRLAASAVQPAEIADPSGVEFLYEPDPAVIRAGLVDALARQAEMRRIDSGIAYLFSADEKATPFAAAYRILASFPYHRRAVQAWLDDHNASGLIVKKRGVPDDPEQVRRQFKLGVGGPTVVLALTRQGRRVWAFMLERRALSPID